MKSAVGFALVVAVLGAAPLQFEVAAQAPASVSAADRREMSRLIDEFLAVYDPGNRSSELEVSKRVFDTGPDFLMVVDAVTLPTWASREARIRERRETTQDGDRQGTHDTVSERIVALGPDAAVLTRVFRYRFTDRTGATGSQEGAVTCAFARRGSQWKVVHYHGSHRPRTLDAR